MPGMSRRRREQPWGPTHQWMEPPFRRRRPFASCLGAVLAFVFLFFLVNVVRGALGLGTGNQVRWTIAVVIGLGVFRVLLTLGVGALARTPRTRVRPTPRGPTADRPRPRSTVTAAARIREGVQRCRSGAYLGKREEEWVCADPESAVMVLGPPARERPAR